MIARAAAPSRRRAVVVSGALVAGLLLSSAAVAQRTEAAFSDTTQTGATWTSGTVTLSGDPTGTVLDLTGLQPGDTGSRCVAVTYTGTAVPVDIRLYTADVVDPDDLGSHVDVEVTYINNPGATPCASMVGTVIFSGSFHALTTTALGHGTGLGTWTAYSAPATRFYRFRYTVGAQPPQDATLELDLVWEARSRTS